MAFGIPQKCMGEWMDVGRVMTALFLQSGQETGEHMRLLYLQKCIPRLLLRQPAGAGNVARTGAVRKRCQRFLRGELEGLFKMATAPPSPDPSSEEEEALVRAVQLAGNSGQAAGGRERVQVGRRDGPNDRTIQCATILAQKGNLGKAMTQLTECGLADYPDED
eukprot:3593361-Rhodomonas_salina.1